MSKTKTQEAQEKVDKRAQDESPAGTPRADKNLAGRGDQRNAPTSGEQGGADDPRGHSSPQGGGQQQSGSRSSGGSSSGFQDEIAQIAQAVKTLTDAGVGGGEAARIALEVWKGC